MIKRGRCGSGRIRALVAFEDEYRTYRAVIATAINILRPHIEVMVARPTAVHDQIRCFAPQVVISSRPKATSGTEVPAWIELSLDPARRSNVCVGARQVEMLNPTLDRLLAVIDQAEELARIGDSRQDR